MPILAEHEITEAVQKLRSLHDTIIKRIKIEKDLQELPYSEHPTDYNFPDAEGNRLLHLAILADASKENIVELINRGADPNLAKTDDTTLPAQFALLYGRGDILFELLKKTHISKIYRSNLDLPEAKNIYDLLIKKLILDPVLDKYKNISYWDRKDKYIATASEIDFSNRVYLNYAAEVGDVNFIKTFYEANKLILDSSDYKINPLLSAVENQQHNALKALLRFVPIDKENEFKYSPLHAAAKLGDIQSAEILFEHNISQCELTQYKPRDESEYNQYRQQWYNNANPGDILFIYSKKISQWTACKKTQDGIGFTSVKIPTDTVLHERLNASQDTSSEALKNSVKSHPIIPPIIQGFPANINQQDRLGRTPLFVALENGQVEFAKTLLKRNPDLKLTTFTGETIFHAATHCPKEYQ